MRSAPVAVITTCVSSLMLSDPFSAIRLSTVTTMFSSKTPG
jgi:hypothetical protein